MKKYYPIILLLLLTTVSLFPFGAVKSPVTSIEMDSEFKSGDQYEIAVRYTFPDGLSQHADPDYFFFTVELPEGWSISEITYPPIDQAAANSDYYSGSAVLKALINVGSDTPKGTYTLTVTAHYQLCNDKSCFPPALETHTVSVNIAASSFFF